MATKLGTLSRRATAEHPSPTLTGMYNVLESLREGRELSAKERVIHGEGLVSVLRQIHDEIDAAVLDAYGWADLLPDLRIAHGLDAAPSGDSRVEARRRFDEAVLERLVALNAERAAEEARGLIRWLRPEYQDPGHRNRTAHGTRAEAEATAIDEASGGEHARPGTAGEDAEARAGDADGAGDVGTRLRLVPTYKSDGDGDGDGEHAITTSEASNTRTATPGDDPATPVGWAKRSAAQHRHPEPDDSDDDEATPTSTPIAAPKAQPWPRDTVDQIRAIADLLLAAPAPLNLDQIAAHFSSRGPWKNRLPQLLDMLLALGRAEAKDEGYVGRR